MIKLTRLNHSIVAINPDHISWVDVSPDTTLCLVAGDKIIVRETLDELIARVIEFRHKVRQTSIVEGDPPTASMLPRRPPSEAPRHSTRPSASILPRRG